MAKTFGFAVLVLVFSLPAHAQHFGGGAGSYGNVGSGGGGASLDPTNFRTLPEIPRTRFQLINVSGTDEFTPSSWMPFERGVAQGRADMAARPKSPAEVAAEYRRMPRERATLAIVQDADGNPIITQE